MSGNASVPARDGPFGFRGAYSVELLYPQSPSIDPETLAAKVKARCPQAQAASADGQPPVLFAHADHVVNYQPDAAGTEGDDEPMAVTTKTVVMPGDRAVDVGALQSALSQTWGWDDAIAAVARSTARVCVADLFAGDLEPRERLAIFESVLLGVIEAMPPTAIHWKPAGKLVDPAAFLRADGTANYSQLPATALNVRVFRIKHSSDGHVLMDTMGLASLGLPDLQILYHNLEPQRVASHLYACALHVLRHGDCLEDGETIEGPSRGQEWTCRHAPSLTEPPRAVVDFDPGPQYRLAG